MTDIIDTLAALDDTALSAKLGLAQKLTEARAGLADMAALDGEARKEAAERVERMLQPSVWPEEFKHIAKSAARHAASGKDMMNDCSPCSLGEY